MWRFIVWPLIVGAFNAYGLAGRREPLSHYRIPALAEARTTTGILVRPTSRGEQWRPLRLKLANGEEAFFGCAPNTPGGACLAHADYMRFAGQPVTVRWFAPPVGSSFDFVVLEAVAGDRSVIAAAPQRARLAEHRAADRRDTPERQIGLAVILVPFMLAILELMVWTEQRKKRSLAPPRP